MIPPDALQLLIICHAKRAEDGDYPRPKDYGEAIRNAFVRQETNELVRELSLVDEQGTGAAVRRFYVDGTDATNPLPLLAAELNDALHTLVVLLITDPMVNDQSVVAWLEKIAQAVKSSAGRHGFLLLATSEGLFAGIRQDRNVNALKEPKGWSVERLGEYALRPAYAAILALNHAHKLLANDPALSRSSGPAAKPRFFISHAKLDGLPLAQALSHVISQLTWLEQFYDAKDIQSGDDFREILERGVLDSMLLVLRTDIYDLRFWCRQEVMWAEAYDRPMLLVDARTDLFSRASILGFTGIPAVRIPDGNLVRVLAEGLREWVRIGVLHRRFVQAVKGTPLQANTELLSRPPSLTSLAEAIKRLKKRAAPDVAVQVVHSEPPLETNHSAAAQELIRSSFPKGSVVSFKTFIAQLP